MRFLLGGTQKAAGWENASTGHRRVTTGLWKAVPHVGDLTDLNPI